MQQQQQNIAKQRTSGRCNSKGRQGGRAKESASRARKRRLAPWSAPDTHGRLLFTIHDTIHFLPAFHLACQPCFLLSFHPSHPPSLPLLPCWLCVLYPPHSPLLTSFLAWCTVPCSWPRILPGPPVPALQEPSGCTWCIVDVDTAREKQGHYTMHRHDRRDRQTV